MYAIRSYYAQPVSHVIAGEAVRMTVVTDGGTLLSDRLETLPARSAGAGNDRGSSIETDADFGLDVMITDWQAPGRANNGDNPVVLTKSDFTFISAETRDLPGGAKELALRFASNVTTIDLV